MNTQTKSYVVTNKAGKRVAGYAVCQGQVLKLTALQAAYELSLGTITPVPAKKTAAKSKVSSKKS